MTYDLIHDAPIHPDDVAWFADLVAAAQRVAKSYNLPIRSVEHLPHAQCTVGQTDRLGDCVVSGPMFGHIRVCLRPRANGRWCDETRDPVNVRRTMAHELAHLRHARHDENHAALTDELERALADDGASTDRRAKIVEKLRKLRAASEGEAEAGNAAAAEAFAFAVNRLMIAHALSEREVNAAAATDDDPVVKVVVNRDAYGIKVTRCRLAWQESLARVVARGHLCSFLICSGTNRITFVGTQSHATVAEYTYGVLVRNAEVMSAHAAHADYLANGRTRVGAGREGGFRIAWLDAFVARVGERLDEAVNAAVAAADAVATDELADAHVRFDVGVAGAPVAASVALIRLNDARAKVNRYMADNYGRGSTRMSALSGRYASNRAGRAAGRAAANALPIGRRAVGSRSQKLLA